MHRLIGGGAQLPVGLRQLFFRLIDSIAEIGMAPTFNGRPRRPAIRRRWRNGICRACMSSVTSRLPVRLCESC